MLFIVKRKSEFKLSATSLLTFSICDTSPENLFVIFTTTSSSCATPVKAFCAFLSVTRSNATEALWLIPPSNTFPSASNFGSGNGRSNERDFGWGAVVSYTKKANVVTRVGKSMHSAEPHDGSGVVVDVLLRCAKLAHSGSAVNGRETGLCDEFPAILRPHCGSAISDGEMRVVPVLLSLLDGCRYVYFVFYHYKLHRQRLFINLRFLMLIDHVFRSAL